MALSARQEENVGDGAAAAGGRRLFASPSMPEFDDAQRYLRRRTGGWRQPWRRFAESRAFRRALGNVGPIETVLDCPSGPGRIFGFWSRRGMSVVGLDRSRPFVHAAQERLGELRCRGRIIHGDVEDLAVLLQRPVDLVACIRFAYYFDAPEREQLLRRLAAASRRHVLVQYKTSETWKGRRHLRLGRNRGKFFTSRAEIRREFSAAGLRLLSFVPHGQLSDRALALGERRDWRRIAGPSSRGMGLA